MSSRDASKEGGEGLAYLYGEKAMRYGVIFDELVRQVAVHSKGLARLLGKVTGFLKRKIFFARICWVDCQLCYRYRRRSVDVCISVARTHVWRHAVNPGRYLARCTFELNRARTEHIVACEGRFMKETRLLRAHMHKNQQLPYWSAEYVLRAHLSCRHLFFACLNVRSHSAS